jgi:hypothetical protein
MDHYVIRVAGHLSAELCSKFPALRAVASPHETSLVGALPDQGALLGVLDHLDMLGVRIVEVRRVDVEAATAEPAGAARVA